MRVKGLEVESKAEHYLIEKGLTPVCRNFLCKSGEIDLVMREGETWVFIEVKYRKSQTYGTALESITVSKQRKLLRTIKFFLTKYHLWSAPCRIDAIGVHPSREGVDQFDWQKNVIFDQ